MKKDEYGRIVLRGNFFLKYLWGKNLWRFLVNKTMECGANNQDPKYPKNLCSLFWGSVFGALFCWVPAIVSCAFLGCFIWGLISLIVGIGFLLGFVVDNTKGAGDLFHPYRRYGEKDEKRLPVAPWHIWLPALMIWLLVKKDFSVLKLVSKPVPDFLAWLFSLFASLFGHPAGLLVLGGIIGTILLVLFFRSTAWQICWEFIKATKDKLCPLIVIEK